MSKVITLNGDHAKTPHEALNECLDMHWQDVVIIGYGEKGQFLCISSHMDTNQANMMCDVFKSHIMKPFYIGEVE